MRRLGLTVCLVLAVNLGLELSTRELLAQRRRIASVEGRFNKTELLSQDCRSSECQQFWALWQCPGRDDVAARLRDDRLHHAGVPVELRDYTSLVRGATRYLREQWRDVREERLRSATSLTETEALSGAWRRYAGYEKLIRQAISDLKLNVHGLHPQQVSRPAIRLLTDRDPAAGISEKTLLRALLGGADESEPERIIEYATRVAPFSGAAAPLQERLRHWEWVAQSPAPALQGPLIRFACEAEREELRAVVSYWLVQQTVTARPPIDADRLSRLLACTPAAVARDALRGLRDWPMQQQQLGALLLADPNLPPYIKEAVVRNQASDWRFAGDIIKNGPPAWRSAILREYAETDTGIPRRLDFESWLEREDLSPGERDLALEAIGKRARTLGASGSQARAQLHQLIADEPNSQTAGRARGILAEVEHVQMRRLSTRQRWREQSREASAKARATLADLESRDAEVDQQIQLMLRVMIDGGSQLPMTHEMLKDVFTFLRAAGEKNHGYLPETLEAVPASLTAEIDFDYHYFPVRAVPMDRIPDEVILLLVTEPQTGSADAEGEPLFLVPGRSADGNQFAASRASLADHWQRSNEARQRIGDTRVEAAELGALAEWLDEPGE